MSECRREGGSGMFGEEGGNHLKHEGLCKGQKCPLGQEEGNLGQVIASCETGLILPLRPSFGVSPAIGVFPAEVSLTGQ